MQLQGPSDADLQRRYYAETAHRYDTMHVAEEESAHLSLCLMLAAVDSLGVRSILDIGSGTGRAISYVKARRPDLVIRGIEPVRELREVGHRSGIREEDLIDGDALALAFEDGAFDLVCEFGALHHIKTPGRAVDEMLRVARKAVLIADVNNFGQGGALSRGIKQLLNALGLWRFADYLKTRGRGYTITEGDGLAYSYSVFNDYARVRAGCKSVHLLNTVGGAINPYRTAPHVTLLGIKR